MIRWIQEMSTLTIENGNPLFSDRWQRLIRIPDSKNNLKIDEDIEEGWMQVVTERIPKFPDTGEHRPYLFAQDDSSKQYFVSRNTLEFESQ